QRRTGCRRRVGQRTALASAGAGRHVFAAHGGGVMMTTAIRAELTKQGHRSASWLLLGSGTLLTVTFGYPVPYVGLSDGSAARGLDAMLRGNFVGAAVGGLPVFVGALALIFGVLVGGGGCGYEQWKA